MIASRSGWHRSSTGTVPDHWAVQATATTDSAGTPARVISRDDAAVIRSHHCSGSCSAPPPGERFTANSSCSAAITSPAVDTRATFSADVPRSATSFTMRPCISSKPSRLKPLRISSSKSFR